MAIIETLQQASGTILTSGLALASLYVLVAAGLALIWNTLGIFNFAHGAIMVVVAYVAWQVSDPAGLGLGLWMGILAGLVVAAILGLLLNWLLVKPFLGQPKLVLIAVMTTLSGALFLENSALLIWGPRIKQLERVVAGNVDLFGWVISAHEAVIILLAPTIMFALWAFLSLTLTGKAIRAVAQNREFAELMGIRSARIYAVTFAIAAVLAGIAGIMVGGIRFLTPGMGADPLLKAMIVVILGGLGSIPGTILGAYLIGIGEAASTYFLGAYWTQAVLFLAFILILVLRPNGLLGKD